MNFSLSKIGHDFSNKVVQKLMEEKNGMDSVWCWCILHVDLPTRPINHGSTKQVSAAYCPNIHTVIWYT